MLREINESIPQCLSHPLIQNIADKLPSLNEILNVLADPARQAPHQVLRAYLNDMQILNRKYYPQFQKEDIQAFSRRLNENFHSDHFCIIVNYLEDAFSNFHSQMRKVLEKHFSIQDLMSLTFETSLFMGRYKETPLGPHCDGYTVFAFPVVGEKEMHFWDMKKEFLEENRIVKKAQKGQMLVLPADFLHVARGPGQFTCTINIGKRPFEDKNTEILNVVSLLKAQSPIDVCDIDSSSLRLASAIVKSVHISRFGFKRKAPYKIVFSEDLLEQKIQISNKDFFCTRDSYFMHLEVVENLMVIGVKENVLIVLKNSPQAALAQWLYNRRHLSTALSFHTFYQDSTITATSGPTDSLYSLWSWLIENGALVAAPSNSAELNLDF